MAEEKSPQKTCFIAMPISTPQHLIGEYGGDADHFIHVLEALFIPAIRLAGMTPLPPISKGAEVIHSDIIDQLQTADLVLADMSSLNANAFLELGIRTALNKPVCLVRDDRTPKIPFDVALINAETYDSRLLGWMIEEERRKLSEHIKTSLERSGNQNALWKHFGFRIAASSATAPSGPQDKLDLVLNELAAIRNASPAPAMLAASVNTRDIEILAKVFNLKLWSIERGPNTLTVMVNPCPEAVRKSFENSLQGKFPFIVVSVGTSALVGETEQ